MENGSDTTITFCCNMCYKHLFQSFETILLFDIIIFMSFYKK